MEDAKIKATLDEQVLGPETPEDVAILYSWANLPGAKYRDFSASRREYRAQQRARIAEQQREAALAAAREMEVAAHREIYDAERQVEEARRLEREAVVNVEVQIRAEDALKRAQEHAELEMQEAQRHEQSAETLRQQAEAARQEMMEARKRAEEQAARYAEFDSQYRAQVEAKPEAPVPGELADPYYYTGQVDPAYFASTPGVRTAQAMRTSTERKAYIFPAHPGSEEFDSGSLQAYRPNTTFAPSPGQELRPWGRRAGDVERRAAADRDRRNGQPGPIQYSGNGHLDGVPSNRMFMPRQGRRSTDVQPTDTQPNLGRDLHIRPSSQRVPTEISAAPEGSSKVLAPTPHDHSVGERRSENAQVATQPEFNVDRRRKSFFSYSEPLQASNFQSEVEEAQLHSAEFRPEEAHRSRDLPVDHRARTTRHPRVENRQGAVPSNEELREKPAVPPAWLTSTEHPATDPSTVPPSNEPVPAPARSFAARENLLGDRSLVPVRETTPRQDWPPQKQAQYFSVAQRSEEQVNRAPRAASIPVSGRGEDTMVRQAELRENDRSPLRLTNRHDRAADVRAVPTTEAGQRDPESAIGVGRPHESADPTGLSAKNPEDRVAEREDAHKPDTLQQSRERVASRWFALKGIIGSQSGERAEAVRPAELRIPALTVLSLSGGVGKTSIVATLGRTLSSLGEKVMLADTNTHGLLPYYFGARDLRPGSVRNFTPPPGSTDAPVLLVNYEVEGSSADEAAQNRLLEDVYRRAKATQRVLVDLSTSGIWMARRLAEHNPWILVPIAPDMNSVLGTKMVERLFNDVTDREGRPVKPFYVLNQFDRALPLHLDVREVLRQVLGDRLLPIMIHRATAMSEALAEGMTVIDYAPGSPVTEDYMHLANWIRRLAAPGYNGSRSARWSER